MNIYSELYILEEYRTILLNKGKEWNFAQADKSF